MFGVVAKLLEILANASQRLLDSRSLARDTDVARALVDVVWQMQDLCVRGGHLLGLARRFADRTADAGVEAAFDEALRQQVAAIDRLRDRLDRSRSLLATVDTQVYLGLAPFLDQKSGLLTRWQQQRRMSAFSTTTLFFLPADSVQQLEAEGLRGATVDGLAAERAGFVIAMAEAIRLIRAAEIRDIRRVTDEQAARLRADIDAARAELARAEDLCQRTLAAIQAAVGPQAMARLRRELARPH